MSNYPVHFSAGSVVAENSDGTVRIADIDESVIGVVVGSRNEGQMEREAVSVSVGGLANIECDDGKVYTVDIGEITFDDLDNQGRIKANSVVMKIVVEDKRPIEHIKAEIVLKIVKKQESNMEIIRKRLNAI